MKNWLVRKLAAVRPVRFFIVVASVFGLLFLFITPPFQGADEVVHFYRAYQVSEGHLLSTATGKDAGGQLPVSLGKVVGETNTPVIAFYPQNKYNEHETKHALSVRNDLQQKFYSFPASATYAPTTYLLTAPGIVVSRVLHLPTLGAMYAARLGNLLSWIVLVGAAIFYVPHRKWAFVAIGLLPMALFQAATINGDAITSGSIILLLALILKCREQAKPLRSMDIIGLLLIAILMALSKPIMFVFLPLFLLLGKNVFSSRKRTLVTNAILILVPFLCFAGWMFLTRNIDGSSAYSNHQNPSAQIGFIIHSPHSYINVIWNTYFYTWGDTITRSFIGIFGWADTPLSEPIMVIGYIGLAALFIATYNLKDNKPVFSKREKQGLWLIIGLYWLAVSTSLYVYYSPVGFKIIYGLQGRYFIPLAVLAAVVLQSKSVRIERALYKRIAVFLPLFLLVCSTITIYVRYFIHNV